MGSLETSPSLNHSVAGTTVTSRVPSVRVSIRRWLGRIGLVLGLIILLLLVRFLLHLLLPRNFTGNGEPLPLSLKSGAFQTLYYSNGKQPLGIVVLGTGDGGWSYWEENTAKHLMDKGYAVAGWDCRKFADSREYEHDDLAQGFVAAAEAVKKKSHAAAHVPVWYGGWSTGAEQSVAAAASAHRAPNLVGLLLAAPGRRGRFGIHTTDLLGVPPTGEKSFALAEMAPNMTGLKVVQFQAGLDPVDDAGWLEELKVPSKVYKLPNCLHDMGGAGPEFQSYVDQAMAWTLSK
ncbi:AcvB/VirJ family lysyl-phosphatidylglycerol hydrolase [Planctomicrobium piriforme]|uniref:Virulence protein (VirJ) n=1 Tax=Planctomicrobium piriforme TaxID=1576369 RepID=A0A1I3NH46_9PLAN|nr:AcvB/VirJ family lysyl-phosphatidylglycerol hydrolase [Planctomicrobium piriforme]SFJ08290.1 virulence protein (VirJ) [Planctomicrobium piriforme]